DCMYFWVITLLLGALSAYAEQESSIHQVKGPECFVLPPLTEKNLRKAGRDRVVGKYAYQTRYTLTFITSVENSQVFFKEVSSGETRFITDEYQGSGNWPDPVLTYGEVVRTNLQQQIDILKPFECAKAD
ncbi:MAG: hypothetical protein ACKOA8_10780, partial [Deltaproteobacteria bacterium]